MSQNGRGTSSHLDEPPAKRRTLQIKLGKPKPPIDLHQPEQASPSLNRGIRISLKRKPSVPESQSTPPRFAAQLGRDDEEDDDDDDEDDEDGEDRMITGATSEQEEDDDEDGNDDQDDEDDDGEDGEDGDDEDAHGDGNNGEPSAGAEGGDGVQGDINGAASNPRTRGKNGAFKSTSAGSSNLSRRPIKRLRSKGLYEALPKLIENLQRRDSYKFFCEPVNPDEVPGYSDVIKTPMDFGTMQRKVDDRLYSHMDEFKADFQLVISNAQTFNPEGTLYYNEAKRIGTWGNRAIEREGMAVNDNGRAGVKGDEIRRQKRLAREAAAPSPAGVMGLDTPTGDGSGRRQLRGSTLLQQQALDAGSQMPYGSTPMALDAASIELNTRSAARGSRFAFSAGVEAIMEAARVTSQTRQRAAIALGLAGGSLTREDSMHPDYGVKGEGDANMDLDDEDDMDASDEEGVCASVARERDSRERSVTVDGPAGPIGRRFGSSQPGGTPSTPLGHRQPSPDALRKRLAGVTGTPIQALASPVGPNAAAGGTSRASKHAKHKQRLGAPGTPKRLLARTGTIGPGTPLAGVVSATGSTADAAAAAAAAAQLMANVSQTHLHPGIANYSFDDDGSINPDDIDDLQTFLTLHRSDRNVLMPTIESLHPIPFIPGDYTGSGAGDKDKDQEKHKDKGGKEKEKVKDKGAAADDGDDDDEDGKGEGKEKGDKDPLSTLPPARPGAPDPLYSAIAPEPEPYESNLSHDVEALPPQFRNLPFHTPSLRARDSPSKADEGSQKYAKADKPCSWSNSAYVEALKNDKRPKKQKDKEREKERETLEDWSYFRPILTRLLEITDVGPYSALMPNAKDSGADAALMKSKAGKQIEAGSMQGNQLPTALLAEKGVEAIKAELKQKRQGLTLPKQLLDRYVQAARNSSANAGKSLLTDEERQDASRILSDMVYAGAEGNAYIRSIAEFVGGAMHHAMLLDEADDEKEQQVAAAERQLRLAAALREAREAIVTPEPTAASRRGPFMWRDTTAEPGVGTATPSVPANDGDQDQQLGVTSTAHTTTVGTPAAVEAEDAKPAISSLLEDLEVVEKQLAPLPQPLAQVVEEEIIRPLTGNTLDLLHLVTVHLKTQGSEALNVEEIEARLLQNKVVPHKFEGVDASLLAAYAVKKPPVEATAIPTPIAPQTVTQKQVSPQPELPLPFTAETEWLKDQPELTRLLDEARQDVDSLGSILNYVIQSA